MEPMRVSLRRLGMFGCAIVLVHCSSSSGALTPDGGKDGGGQGGSDTGVPPKGDGGGGGGGAHSDSGGPPKDGGGGGTDSGPMKSDAGTVGGVPGGVAGPGTMIGSCEIFPADNPWNVAVDGPGVMVIHTYDSELPSGTQLHPDLGGYTKDNGGIPYNVVPSTQADETTTFNTSASQSDPGPMGWVGPNPVTMDLDNGTTAYPFFVGMKIEGDPKAGGTPGKLKNDQHAIVLQQGSSGCTAYEAWQCVVVSAAPFPCANGAVWDLTMNQVRPAGWTSADAAGLSILAGLARLSEVQAGVIHHAIRVTFNSTQEGYIAPASHAASSNPLGSAYPPMGLRIRMKASVTTSSYTAASQVIMTAMKKYGLIVADNGTDWYFQGDSDDGWTAMAPDGKDTIVNEVVGDFRNLTGADFEAVYSGDPVSTGL
jgi:hypothetical protein